MITVLTYDGSFEGFLTAVFEIFEYKFLQPEIIPDFRNNDFLFAENHLVITDGEKAERVLKKLSKQLGKEGLTDLIFGFLSENVEREKYLWQVIKYAIEKPNVNVLQDYSHFAVSQVRQWSRSVWREKHRVEAFIRFEKLKDDIFVAVMEPDFDVLSASIQHFIDRFRDQKWIITDLKRGYGYFYDLTDTHYFTLTNDSETLKNIGQNLHIEELFFQKLWQLYFKSTTITERKNTKLHVQHVPKRYWKYLTEKH